MAPVCCSLVPPRFPAVRSLWSFVLSSLASFHCIFLLDTCWPSSILSLLFLHSSHHTFTSPYTMAYASTTLTMHPLWMNPPTPMFAPSFQQQQQHIYLTAPDNISEAQSIYSSESSDESTNVPDWQPLPGTTPLFGSCRRGRSRKVDTCTSGHIFERDVECNTSSTMPSQRTIAQFSIPRKPVPSRTLPPSGPPPDKPLPPVPAPPALPRLDSLSASAAPAVLLAHTIPAPVPAQPQQSNKLSTKVSQYLKMPSLTSTNSTSTLKSFQSSRALPYNPLPPIPQSPLFDLATKKTALIRCQLDDSDDEEDEVRDGGWFCLRLFSCFGGRSGRKVIVRGSETTLVGGVRKLRKQESRRGRQTSRPVSVAFERTASSAQSSRPPSSAMRTSSSSSSSASISTKGRSRHSIRYSTSTKRASRHGVRRSTSASTKRFSSLSLSRRSTRLSFYADTDDASPQPPTPEDIIWKSKVTSRHADEGRYLPFISVQAVPPHSHLHSHPSTNTRTSTTVSTRAVASTTTTVKDMAKPTAYVTSASVQAWLQLHRNVSVYRGVERTQGLRLEGLLRAGVRVV